MPYYPPSGAGGGSGTPGGSDSQVQVNSQNTFAGFPNLRWIGSSNELNLNSAGRIRKGGVAEVDGVAPAGVTGLIWLDTSASSFTSSSAGLAGTGLYYLMTSGNTGWPNVQVYSSALIGYRDLPVQAAKLYASTSAARIDAGTSLWRLLYSATTQQFSIWQFILPRDFSGSPFVRIIHGNDSSLAVAKSVSWIIDQWGFLPGNTLSAYTDTFGGTNITTVALSAGYSAGLIQTMTVPLATVVSMNVGNLIRLRVSGSGAGGNTELFGLNLEYARV